MPEIIKRLEIIKSSIVIEDLELIELQVSKLKKLPINEDVKNIINRIEKSDFVSALNMISNFINNATAIQVWDDPQIYALKTQLKQLEIDFLTLSERFDEVSKTIEAFNSRYILRLGNIIYQILFLRKLISQKYNNEFEHFESQFKKEQKQESAKAKISETDQKNLKKLYREASKLCHPDVVAENFKREAEEIFKQLNNAYSTNNIKLVEEILFKLKKGNFETEAEKINKLEIIKNKIAEMQEKIKNINLSINRL